MRTLRLGVNIDHVATIRNARGGVHPSPVRAALFAQESGADGITAHLREDRRHISDNDIKELKAKISLPLNFEMAATEEMLEIALSNQPNAACIVPEKREELTTEGGLDIIKHQQRLQEITTELKQKNIRVSLFIEANEHQIDAAKEVGADIIELHTGTYTHCEFGSDEQQKELAKIKRAASMADHLGIEVHAGHGLCYQTVKPIAAIEEIVELNIGHFLIGESIFVGMEQAIKQMQILMTEARGL
ncbi:MAG: pyridoxine 5'-phosphate synthase [Rickettsiales bacterium]|nr:pyridoxine 5'-phosphate synthase [Rickettsiales bacterium]